MRTIHKQALPLKIVQTLWLPGESKILCAQNQGEQLTLWYECEPGEEPKPRTVLIIGTGYTIPDTHKLSYISTVQMGSLVWHVYEVES